MRRSKVLVLCTGNSCRSHMAEGILKELGGDLFEVYSAGSKPAGYVHPMAIEVLAEWGIDLSNHRSKHLDEFRDQAIDTVITVCGNADQVCPTFPGQSQKYHWGFVDPAHAEGSDEAVRACFRKVRDEIRAVMAAYVAGFREAVAQEGEKR